MIESISDDRRGLGRAFGCLKGPIESNSLLLFHTVAIPNTRQYLSPDQPAGNIAKVGECLGARFVSGVHARHLTPDAIQPRLFLPAFLLLHQALLLTTRLLLEPFLLRLPPAGLRDLPFLASGFLSCATLSLARPLLLLPLPKRESLLPSFLR